MATGIRASHGAVSASCGTTRGRHLRAGDVRAGCRLFHRDRRAGGRGGERPLRGVRYVQGAGVHGGIGLLADRGGDDAYVARHGVGQGMGLDMALGALQDDGGGDAYEAGSLAQGLERRTASGSCWTAGMRTASPLPPRAGARSCRARPARGLVPGRRRSGRPLPEERRGRGVDLDRPDGPAGGPPYRIDPPGDYACPADAPPAPVPDVGEPNGADPAQRSDAG